jgi:hypothetical protein
VWRFEPHAFGTQQQRSPPSFHRIQCVEDEIGHDLSQLKAVRAQPRQPLAEFEDEVRPGFHRRVQQPQRRRQLRVHFERFDGKAAAPSVGKHLLAQLRGFAREHRDFSETAR